MYSIDETFIELTPYINLYNLRPLQIANLILDDVLNTTGITAAIGLGTNLYLAKVAMDITAKHSSNNLRCLTEKLYKQTLWLHQPLTDFWQIGKEISDCLYKYEIVDMYGIAHFDKRILYKEFGKNAEYLIDHANGIEPTLISDIKNINQNQIQSQQSNSVRRL